MDPYRSQYPYQRARMWLDRYGFTLERLQAELDADDLNDRLDELWGFDGRQYAGEDFTADSPTGSGDDRWDACDFSRSILTGANFHQVDLTDSIFTDADLTEATLSGANLTRVSFRDADLSRANLDAADVRGADFRGVKGVDPTTLADLRVRGAVVDGPTG
jgi:uncharacterized protein YjbI with pentapeptide repeats